MGPAGVQSSFTKTVAAVSSFLSSQREPLKSVCLPTKPTSLEEFDLESLTSLYNDHELLYYYRVAWVTEILMSALGLMWHKTIVTCYFIYTELQLNFLCCMEKIWRRLLICKSIFCKMVVHRANKWLLSVFSSLSFCFLSLCLTVSGAVWNIIDDMATWGLIVKWINISCVISIPLTSSFAICLGVGAGRQPGIRLVHPHFLPPPPTRAAQQASKHSALSVAIPMQHRQSQWPDT